MNLFNRTKKALLIALFIALMPAPTQAAWYDTLWQSVKENSLSISAAVAFGAATVLGLLWWKSSGTAKAQSKKRASLSAPSPTKTIDAALAAQAQSKDAEKRAALSALETRKNDEQKDSLRALAVSKEAEKTNALKQLDATKDQEKEAALAQLRKEQELEKETAKKAAIDAFKLQATAQFGQLDAVIGQEKARMEKQVTELSEKLQKFEGAIETLKTKHQALRLKYKKVSKALHDTNITEFFKMADEICARGEKLPAYEAEKNYAIKPEIVQSLLIALKHIKSRLKTLHDIALGKENYPSLWQKTENYDFQNPYQFLNINPIHGAMMGFEVMKSAYEKHFGQTESLVKNAVLVLFENEFSKKYLDLFLQKDATLLKQWIAFIKDHTGHITALQKRTEALHKKISDVLAAITKTKSEPQVQHQHNTPQSAQFNDQAGAAQTPHTV